MSHRKILELSRMSKNDRIKFLNWCIEKDYLEIKDLLHFHLKYGDEYKIEQKINDLLK
jgi:hypothetical protein